MAGLGLEPTSPSSREEIAGALNHSATTICWEMELNNRIYINLRLATTPKELEIHHGNFLWVSDSLSLPLIQKLLTDVYYQFSSKNSPLFSPSWMKKNFFQKLLSRFLCSKKLENMNLAHFGPGSRPISDNFFFVWKVFLIDFLSKMKSQKGSLGFRIILKWWFLVYSEEIFENNSRVQPTESKILWLYC